MTIQDQSTSQWTQLTLDLLLLMTMMMMFWFGFDCLMLCYFKGLKTEVGEVQLKVGEIYYE